MNGMAEELTSRDTYKAALAELIGTMFLSLAAMRAGSPYAVALTLAALVYAIGRTSGCHINPAVTLGLLVARQLSVAKAALYIVAQFGGALLATLLSLRLGPVANLPQAAGAWAEFWGFGLLILTVLAVSHKAVPEAGGGVAIGAALAAGLALSGGILNPAVAFAADQERSAATWATLLGAVTFALLFKLLAPQEDGQEQARKPQRVGRPRLSFGTRQGTRTESGTAD
jgi:aquaporin Z